MLSLQASFDIKDYPYKELIGYRTETLSPIPGVLYGVRPKPDFNMYYDFTKKSMKIDYDYLIQAILNVC